MNPLQKKIEQSIKINNYCYHQGDKPIVSISKWNIRMNTHCYVKLGMPQQESYRVNYYINQKDNTLILELCVKEADGLYKYSRKTGGNTGLINNALAMAGKPKLIPGHYPVAELYADALNSKYYVEISLDPQSKL